MGYPIEAVNRIILFIFLLYQAPLLHATLCGELHIMKSILIFKSTHFVITLVVVLHVIIVASAHNCICDYIMMNPNY